MLSKPERITHLEGFIATVERDIEEIRARAAGFFHSGKKASEKINEYFSPMFRENTLRLNKTLEAYSLPIAAGWEDPRWESWKVIHGGSETLIRVGELSQNGTTQKFAFPAYLPFIGANRTYIIQAKEENQKKGLELFQSLLVRTALMFPYQARYTLLDPAGNGLAFPMRRNLPLVSENTADVRRDLDMVIADIQRIIETYLDAEVTSFEQIQPEMRINERFHFIFAANFPDQYDRRAIEALQNIANTGTKAGVYVFLHHCVDHPFPRDMSMDDFKNSLKIDLERGTSSLKYNLELTLDSVPAPELQTKVFTALKDAKPPERIIDYDHFVNIPIDKWWTKDSVRNVETPIGARGGSDSINIWFGVKEDNQPCAHGMLGAMTGAGKSNLYHVLICGLATRYSPEELRFYLIDGKDGVEFQPYRHLPHAEVVSLRSSPELSRSVLAELIAEKERRNGIFQRVGVNDFSSYRRKGSPEGKIPRLLLLIDEYQELFEGDRDGQASSYLLQLSQQGRSAGIHMLLASQRFGAAGMLNQTAIFGNMHLLMAMQMRTSDVQSLTEFGRRGKGLIAACDLPGKIVVNDHGGDDSANLFGKVAYLRPDQRDKIIDFQQEKSSHLPESALPRRVVFNGREQPNLFENPYLDSLLRREKWMTDAELETFARQPKEQGGLGIENWYIAELPSITWLGQEFNVRGLATVILRRRVAENMLIIGSMNPARYGMLAAAILSLCASFSPQKIKFVIADRSISGSQWSQVLQQTVDNILRPAAYSCKFAREIAQVEAVTDDLIAELDRRKGLSEEQLHREPSLFVVMTELDSIETFRRKLDRYGGMADTPNGEKICHLYTEGAPLGIHLILSFTGVRPMANIIEERRGLYNFRHRIALQMSEDESHTFVRSRKASQLQIDGALPVCGLYFDTENDQSIRFKPYSIESASGENGEPFAVQLSHVQKSLKRSEAV